VRESAAGLFLVFVFVLLFPLLTRSGLITSNHAVVLLSFLVIWVPLLGCVLVATFRGRSQPLMNGFRTFIQPIDLVWGLAVGLLARVVATLLEVGFYGQPGSPSASFDEPSHDAWWIFATIAAPVLLGPIIEELFFRGLILKTILRLAAANPPSRSLQLVAIAISAVTFAILHVVGAESPRAALTIWLSTFIFGGGAATLTTITGRLGPAVIAHIVFNALVVIPALT
jgi:membrane protease YdiL (CAAX protease family)